MPKTKQKHSVGEKPGNVVIRLSDLGIFDRTPEQVDLQIQAQRIFRILDDTIEKLKISACLPAFLKNNACWLRKYCDAADVDYIQNACFKYSPQYFSNHVVIKAKPNKPTRFAKKLDTLVDPRMAHVLELLWNNDAVKEKCSQNYNMLVDDNAKTLVSCVKNLRRIAQMKLPQTASEQRSRETHLKNAWEENKRMKEEITALKQEIRDQKRHYQSLIDDKNRLFIESENKIKTLMNDFKINVKRTTNESETTMARNTVKNNQTLDMLQIEAKASVQHYTTVLGEHMLNEKKLRSNRLKIETQLISWLNKFDDDMQERQQQYDDIKAAYDADKIEMENLKALFDVQEKEYVIAMEEKAEEEARLTELMVQNFLRNHAARIIQKCWRLYRRRKLERPKKKKGKGKR